MEEELKGGNAAEIEQQLKEGKIYEPLLHDDQDNMGFKVSNPVLNNGHIEYTVKGVDSQGAWEGSRRYN